MKQQGFSATSTGAMLPEFALELGVVEPFTDGRRNIDDV
jgi:hypothetical protein